MHRGLFKLHCFYGWCQCHALEREDVLTSALWFCCPPERSTYKCKKILKRMHEQHANHIRIELKGDTRKLAQTSDFIRGCACTCARVESASVIHVHQPFKHSSHQKVTICISVRCLTCAPFSEPYSEMVRYVKYKWENSVENECDEEDRAGTKSTLFLIVEVYFEHTSYGHEVYRRGSVSSSIYVSM